MNSLSKIIFSLALVFTVAFMTSCQKEVIEPPQEVDKETEVSQDIELNEEEVSDERFMELLEVAEDKATDGGERMSFWSFDGEFEINYGDSVCIGVGGALYNHTTAQWMSGGAAGNAQIPPAVFADLQASLTAHVRIQVEHSWFFLRRIKLTYLDKGNQVQYGLYNANTGEYLFLGLGGGAGAIGNTPCGVIAMAAIVGQLSADEMSLDKGKFGMGFIAGCGALLIGAKATFSYKGIRIL